MSAVFSPDFLCRCLQYFFSFPRMDFFLHFSMVTTACLVTATLLSGLSMNEVTSESMEFSSLVLLGLTGENLVDLMEDLAVAGLLALHLHGMVSGLVALFWLLAAGSLRGLASCPIQRGLAPSGDNTIPLPLLEGGYRVEPTCKSMESHDSFRLNTEVIVSEMALFRTTFSGVDRVDTTMVRSSRLS